MIVLVSWAQALLLRAAANVDCLPFRARWQVAFNAGVWRSLVKRGLLRQCSEGWQITEQGRSVLRRGLTVKHGGPKGPYMRARYYVVQAHFGWAVMDRLNSGLVESFSTREPARRKAKALNLEIIKEKAA